MGWLEAKPLPSWADAGRLEERLEAALRLNGSDGLVALVREFFAEGFDEGQALGILEQFLQHLRTQDREADEDQVIEVISLLGGWCDPHAIVRRDKRSNDY